MIEILAKVRKRLDGSTDVVVRKVVTDDATRRVVGKYGLTKKGEWRQIKENEEYPRECYLDVYAYEERPEDSFAF